MHWPRAVHSMRTDVLTHRPHACILRDDGSLDEAGHESVWLVMK